ncbi:MAG: FRG domain-containing protein [Candidatus Delongbacteria bacterium]|jgi:hypothetical protein|nr:FRG domain-containing protein [Candidatus Delongbacteria bacterium]
MERKLADIHEFLKEVHEEKQKLKLGEVLLFRGHNGKGDLLPKLLREELLDPNEKPFDIEDKLYDEFKIRATPYLDMNKDFQNEWNLLVLAQHYGLKTRLLDWTENPLVALFFTVYGSNFIENGEEREIWMLKATDDNIININNNKNTEVFRSYTNKFVFKPSAISQRVVTQSSWFTHHSKKLQKLNDSKSIKNELICFSIPDRLKKEDIEKYLTLMEINTHTLFPDLESLCKMLNEKKYKPKPPLVITSRIL